MTVLTPVNLFVLVDDEASFHPRHPLCCFRSLPLGFGLFRMIPGSALVPLIDYVFPDPAAPYASTGGSRPAVHARYTSF